MVYVRTSDFPRKKLGGCHSLVRAHPPVIYSELATPFDHCLQANVPPVSCHRLPCSRIYVDLFSVVLEL